MSRLKSAADAFRYGMGMAGGNSRKGQVSSEAKSVAGLLFLLIIVAVLLPVAWGIMQTSGDVTIAGQTFNITDVPGGTLLQEPVFILVALGLMVGFVLRSLDII